MLTLIENANIFAPAPLGIGTVLIGGGTILHYDGQAWSVDRAELMA